jgi:amino acid permease
LGATALAVLNLVYLVTGLIAYLILAGDFLTSWLHLANINCDTIWLRALLILAYALIIPIALSCPRNISFLSYLSTAPVFCVLFFVVSIVYEAIGRSLASGLSPTARRSKLDVSLFASFALFGVSFALPAVVLPVVRPYNPTIRKRKIVLSVTVSIALLLVCAAGVCGYLCFGDDSQGNILKNFKDGDVLIGIVRGAFFIIVSCAYPVLSQSIQASWSQLIFSDGYPAGLPTMKRLIVLLVTNAIPLLIAMFLPDVRTVLEVGGALGGSIVNFVFPAIFWIKHSSKPLSDIQNVLCIALIVFGVVASVISTYAAVTGAIKTFSE